MTLFIHLCWSLNIQIALLVHYYTGSVPNSYSLRYIIIWIQLKLQDASPSSLDPPWAINLIFRSLNHCVDQRELSGTDIKFSLFRPPFAWPEGLTSSPFPLLSIGEKNRSFRGVYYSISFYSLSSGLFKGRRRSWQVGSTVSDTGLNQSGLIFMV